ncbi:MAG: hypothetical protein F4X40_03530 [Chloroflexi bacterium]|nr:hypothetical protein [Chloroflexota bacterium]
MPAMQSGVPASLIARILTRRLNQQRDTLSALSLVLLGENNQDVQQLWATDADEHWMTVHRARTDCIFGVCEAFA